MRIENLFWRGTSRRFPNLKNTIINMSSGRVPCNRKELDLGITLNGGQSFRWTPMNDGVKYRGSFSGHVWTLSQIEDNVFYQLHSGTIENDEMCIETLKKYFNLAISLTENMKKWSACDAHFKKCSGNVSGVRILNQDIVENIFSFICSSNNNISRISSMVEKLCTNFGAKICEVDKKQYHDFPTLDALIDPKVEPLLRMEGFGYRAAYVAKTAKRLKELGGRDWLESLHRSSGTRYETARQKLMELPGVGPKVADCICLMSLGHLEAIPVDTHIFQIAQAVYLPGLSKQKTVTPRIHEEVSTHLRKRWGPLAGWAQAIVFCAKITGNGHSPTKKFTNTANDDKNYGPKKKLRKR